MKKTHTLATLLLISCTLAAQEWPPVNPEARPGTRWWWMGSAVDSANLAHSLSEYAKAGLGGVEVTSIYGIQNNEAHEIPFLSDRWMQMLQYTQQEAARQGITVDMSQVSGWPFGGPQVSTADAATKALFREYQLAGGASLPNRIEPEDEKQRLTAPLSRLMAYNGSQRIDLTSRVNNGKLEWKAPPGDWRLIALFIGKTGQQVKRAGRGGKGLVLDHFSAPAVERYLATFEQAFDHQQTNYPHAFFNDSYEVYGADWTPGLLDEFAKRRGYPLENYFTEFLDTTRPEITRRIVSDYRETLSELLLENFTRPWTAWAHRHGSLTRNQAHGSPGNLIDLYAAVDIPECEGFGLSEFHIRGLRKDSLTRKNDSDLSMLKYASSAAHIAGKPLVSAETFTWLTEHFRTSLSQCKPDADLMFVSGVNHIFLHGTPYSPREAEWPGWLFYASVNFSPTNTLWRDLPAFTQYIARCQSFLQMGQPDNDLGVYLPLYDIWDEQPGHFLAFEIHKMQERAPRFIEVVHQINACGYGLDYMSDAFLLGTRFEDGRIVTAGGASYRALVIPPVQYLPVEVLQHLLQLAEAGARVVFMEHYPADVPGYGQLEERQRAFRQLKAELPDAAFTQAETFTYGKGQIITGTAYAQTLPLTGVKPEKMQTDHGLSWIRRSNADGHHYFVASLQENDVEGWIPLAVEAQAAALYDPLTGTSGVAQLRQHDGQTQVYLQLRSGESLILRTYARETVGKPWLYAVEQTPAMTLNTGWKLRFTESDPAIMEVFNVTLPHSWTTLNHPDAARNRGTARYETTFTLPKGKADDWLLDLGDVRESARVWVNGREAGTCWAVPYRLRIGSLLKPGTNRMEVEVTNLPANRIADYDRRSVPWRIFEDINLVNLQYKPTTYAHWQPMPSGLCGEVKLIPLRALFP